ncbi:MAG: NUDIX domain-containing protein [Gammaproteobacteria bacterium]|nr:NUDIX domain-containing protein [Gammaproteobacteria bacterium]
MTALDPIIRNTVRALIVRRRQILLLRKRGGGRGERFALPGGAQETGESLAEALQRECEEEIDSRVDVGRLVHIAEFCKLRDTLPPSRRHLVEFLFLCDVPAGYEPRSGPHPDKHQVGVVWVDLDAIPDMPMHPDYLIGCLAGLGDESNPHYLGMYQDAPA